MPMLHNGTGQACGFHLRPDLFAVALCVLHRVGAIKQVHSSLLRSDCLMGDVLGGVVVDEKEVHRALQCSLLL